MRGSRLGIALRCLRLRHITLRLHVALRGRCGLRNVRMRLLRLLIMLLRLMCGAIRLRLDRLWHKQRLARAVINQRFHRRKRNVIRHRRRSARRLRRRIALLLRRGKLTCQLSLFSGVFLFQAHLCLIRFAVTLLLGRGKLARQLVLIHSIGFFFRNALLLLRHTTLRFFTGALFGHSLGRQFDAIRGKLTTRRHTNAVRARQLRANALFHLRTRCFAGRRGKGEAGGLRCCRGCLRCSLSSRRSDSRLCGYVQTRRGGTSGIRNRC